MSADTSRASDLEQLVQLVFKGGDQQVERALDALLGFGDVLTVHPLAVQLGISMQQLEGGGQVVAGKLAQLLLLVRIGLGQGEDAGADLLQPVGLALHVGVGDGLSGLMQLAQQFLVLGLPAGIGLGLGSGLGRDGGRAPHHQKAGAVVDVSIRAEIAVVDGVFQHLAALFFGQARRREQLVQGDVVPAAHHLVQPALGPQAPLEHQAEGQRAAAAHDSGRCWRPGPQRPSPPSRRHNGRPLSGWRCSPAG